MPAPAITARPETLEEAFARIDAAFSSVMPRREDRWLVGVTIFDGVADSIQRANDHRLRIGGE